MEHLYQENFRILKLLKSNSDKQYALFSSKLTPGVDPKLFLGVRVPIARKIAKEYIKDKEHYAFLNALPHKYYDENMLHSLLISQIKDYPECIKECNKFLPYIDNWAVCDILSPKIFIKNKDKLINEIKKWIKDKKIYTIRFGIEMLMSFYLDDDFKEEYLKLVSKVRSKEYYVNMMIAWYFATALAKQYKSTIIYLKNNLLPVWVHNKTIQKAVESYRISDKDKQYLKTLKRKE